MISKILGKILPPPLRRRLGNSLYAMNAPDRKKQEDAVPKVKLHEKNIKNCRLLLNREALLARMPENGKVAEIGVNRGDFSEIILKINQPEILHLVDIWDSERYHHGLYEGVEKRFRKQMDQGRVRIHRALSLEAAEDFPDSYFDWIYIDTGHTYELTREELRIYALKIRHGGIIAGHDYVKGNWVEGLRYGVMEAVHEFCVEYGWELIFLTVDLTENQSFAMRKIT